MVRARQVFLRAREAALDLHPAAAPVTRSRPLHSRCRDGPPSGSPPRCPPPPTCPPPFSTRAADQGNGNRWMDLAAWPWVRGRDDEAASRAHPTGRRVLTACLAPLGRPPRRRGPEFSCARWDRADGRAARRRGASGRASDRHVGVPEGRDPVGRKSVPSVPVEWRGRPLDEVGQFRQAKPAVELQPGGEQPAPSGRHHRTSAGPGGRPGRRRGPGRLRASPRPRRRRTAGPRPRRGPRYSARPRRPRRTRPAGFIPRAQGGGAGTSSWRPGPGRRAREAAGRAGGGSGTRGTSATGGRSRGRTGYPRRLRSNAAERGGQGVGPPPRPAAGASGGPRPGGGGMIWRRPGTGAAGAGRTPGPPGGRRPGGPAPARRLATSIRITVAGAVRWVFGWAGTGGVAGTTHLIAGAGPAERRGRGRPEVPADPPG